MITDLPKSKCLNCGHNINVAGSLKEDTKPESGDTVLCIKCGGVMKLSDDLKPRALIEQERIAIIEDKDYMDFLIKHVQRIRFIGAMKG